MPQIFVTQESDTDIIDQQHIDQLANRIVSTGTSGLGSFTGTNGNPGTNAQDDLLSDILNLSNGKAEQIVDLLGESLGSTTTTAGSAAETTEVFMAGEEINFQDGDPKDPPASDDENDIVKALKEQGFIKDGPPDYGESDPDRLEEIELNYRISTLADSEVTNGGFDSGIEIWI